MLDALYCGQHDGFCRFWCEEHDGYDHCRASGGGRDADQPGERRGQLDWTEAMRIVRRRYAGAGPGG